MKVQEIKKYLRENELDIQRAYASLIIADLAFKGYAEAYKVHGMCLDPMFCYISYAKLGSFYQIMLKSRLAEIGERQYKNFQKDPSYIKKTLKKHHGLALELREIWLEFEKEKSRLSKKGYLNFYKKFNKLYLVWWGYTSLLEEKGEIIDMRIVPAFSKRHDIDASKARDIVGALSHPDELAIFTQERRDFWKLCLAVYNTQRKNVDNNSLLKDKEISRLLEAYIKKYFWIKTDFYKAVILTPESVLVQIFEELKEKNLREIKKELEKIENSVQKMAEKKKNILKNIKLSDQDKKDLKFSADLIRWHDLRKEDMMKTLYYFHCILQDAAEKFDLKYHDVACSTISEFETFLKNGGALNHSDIKKRNEGVYFAFERNNQTTMIYGNQATELLNLTISKNNHTEVKGTVASKGKKKSVEGKVSIIHNPARDNFATGDILVTSMTRVEFVPLMKKAKAIITDEGGMACHAAIVSRELGIPAVIGTKNATQALKTGDMVSMDLENGVIKTVKK